MKKIILALALFSVINFNQPLAHSTPTNPTTISYQGVLTDGNDDLLADGEHSVTFKLYDVLSNGSALWTETQTVSTTNGLFNVDLGSVTGVTGVDFTKQLYLEVTVESIVLSPRIKFTAQPYAFMAKSLTETLPLANGGTGATTAEGARTNLQLGSLAVEDFIGNDMWSGSPLSVENGGTGTSSIEELQTSLGLGELAYLESVSNDYWSGEDLAIENGGTGASTVEDARTNLGLGSLALEDNVDDNFWSGEPLSVINGGTGANDLETAQANLGITTLQSDVTDLETEISALGTISTQAASSVAITGGTVNGTSVGATSASTGKFTTLEATSFKLPGGTDGQVLSYNASTGNATWADAASGGSGGGGGADVVSNETFSGTSSSSTFVTAKTITVPSTGKYLINSMFTINYASGEGLNEYTIRVKQGANLLTAIGLVSHNDATTSYGKLDDVLDLTSTTDLTLELMTFGLSKSFTGNVKLTKLTAPSGGSAGTVDLASEDVTGTLPLANGGTGSTTAAGARTNLELGTISTQAASNVAITGGTVNGTSVGATTASTGKFTSTETGTLKVTGGTPGTGKVLTSDANGTATWADAASGGGAATEVFAIKTADETITSNATVQDDDHLTLSWGATTGVYRIKAFIIGERAGSGNSIKYTFTKLGAGTPSYSYFAVDGNWDMAPSFGTTQTFWGTVAREAVTITAVIDATVANVTGVKFQWAQTTSSATSCKVLKGSYMSYEKISD